MKITIKKEVFEHFHPDLKVAFILIEGIDNASRLEESVHLLKEAEHLIRLTFNKESIKTHHLVSPWVAAQQEFGRKAKHYHTSVERLMRAILRKKTVASRDVVTNLVRYTSLKHLVPMAVDDPDKLVGQLSFHLANGKERISLLEGVKKGAFVYTDQAKKKNLLGAKLDYWKSPRTKLRSSSKRALVHLEALPPLSTGKFAVLLAELVDILKEFTGGKVKVLILSRSKNSGEFSWVKVGAVKKVAKRKRVKRKTLKRKAPAKKAKRKLTKKKIVKKKRVAKRKTPKKRVSRRKVTKRKPAKRKVSRKSPAKRKVSKRRAVKRKTTKRKAPKRKTKAKKSKKPKRRKVAKRKKVVKRKPARKKKVVRRRARAAPRPRR